MERHNEVLDNVIIKFAGDSGDGMQLTGTQFTNTAALFGNDLSTFPDFPAEIRAPQGTLAGVSGYQLHFGSVEIFTPGDHCDVLVVMNAAALKANLKVLKAGYHLGETRKEFSNRYNIGPAKITPGTYRNIMGNQATAIGLIAASKKSGLQLFYGTYPITPASDILHELSRHKN